MEQFQRSDEQDESAAAGVDQELLRRGIRFNTILLALVMGIVAGLGIFVFTHLSILVTGERAGRYLNLLGIFFPGYRATPGGAWFGLIWGFVAGATAGGFVYYAYARAMGAELAEKVDRDAGRDQVYAQPVLRMSGHALGLALGLLMAIQLYLASVWLMVAGSGEKSPHAILLAEYLPGYGVTPIGGLIGAVDIFVFTYGLSRLLAWVYNRVVSLRSQEGAR